MRPLDKLVRMSRREIAWRTRVAFRTQRDRALYRLRRPQWDRSRLQHILSEDLLDPVLQAHLAREDWPAAQRVLVRALQARPRLFTLDPRTALELRHEITRRWPRAATDAAARADRIMSGRYDLLGYRGLSFDTGGGRPDWHFDPVHRRHAPRTFWSDVPYLRPEVGDHKIIWELNRHQHWLALGRALWLTRDRRYAWAIVSDLESWIDDNPPFDGVNWASALELGFRSLSWIWALHFLLADTGEGSAGPSRAPWLIDLLNALDRQLTQLEGNLSYYFSPNTHLTGEALALYVAGVSLPELRACRRWTATGRRILLAEIDRQIGADGGHAERSTHYHRYTLDFYLLALLMAERSKDTEAIARFTDAATRTAEFARTMADDQGRLPLIGDDDGGMLWPIAGRACDDVRDSLGLAAVLLGRPDFAPWGVPEEVFWIAGRTALDQEPFIDAHRTDAVPTASRALTDTGYVVARDGAGGHLVFDVGAHGYMNGGHAHADALSVTLALAGRPLLIDPGTSTYTMNPAIRDRLRRTANHNTLALDGQSSSIPSGPFHWYSRTDAQSGALRQNARFDWAEGWHDGFGAARHRRNVFRAPGGGWLIVDEVLGHGRHAADLHWHFDPAWSIASETSTSLRATHYEDQGTVWIVHDAAVVALMHGDEESGLGWCAPAYGTLIPTWTARLSRGGTTPFSFVTFIAAASRCPSVTGLAADCDPGGAAVAVRVRHESVSSITMLRPGEPSVRDTRSCAVGRYHTDARLLHYASVDGRLRSLAACDAHHVLALHDGWLSIAADTPISDICLEVDDDRIDVWSSSPASRLRIEGTLVPAARVIRLNGRELAPYARERTDSVVAFGSDWGEAGRNLECVASPASRI
jgi:hypothetical protein